MYEHLAFELPQYIETGFVAKVTELCTDKNINQKFYLGRTPLHIAVICAQVDIIKVLLQLDPSLEIKDDIGLTAGEWAYYLKNKRVQ